MTIKVKISQQQSQTIPVKITTNGGLAQVTHDDTLVGLGTSVEPLGINPEYTQNITDKIDTVAGALAEETANREHSDAQINERIDALPDYVLNPTAEQRDAINSGINSDKIAGYDASISALNSGLQTEQTARADADTTLQDNIDSEASTRASEDSKLATGLSDETSARENADAVLQTNIDNELVRATGAENALGTRITDEATARSNADNALQSNIDAEESARKSADSALQDGIDKNATDILAEISNRTSADTALDAKITATNKSLSDTKSALEAVDTGLQEQIDTINGKIPTQASTTNQLADKDFVNSSINNMAAFYITSNADGDAFGTKSALVSGPWYSQGVERNPTINDYAIVLSDETKNNACARYMYDGAQWDFQYVVNDTPMTAAQVAAINSTITKDLVDTYNAHVANATIHVTQADKDTWNAKQDAGDYATNTALNAHITNKDNPHSVTATQVGLGNVKNVDTSNADNITSGTLSNNRLGTIPYAKLSGVQSTIADLDTIRSGAKAGATAVQPNDNVSVLKNDAGYLTQHQSLTDLGITATASEINVLDGITASTTELNYTDGVTSNIQTQLNSKQSTISDLATIRSNAQSGKTASDTIATYGNIVTHNTSEFATSAQGTKADTAVQPADLATVATSGSYNDLSNKPTISTTLAGLTGDVSISSPAQGQHLVYDGSKWKNTASAETVAWGDITGTLSEQSDLQTALNAKQGALTTTQLNAANSGITSTKVSSYDTHIANKSNPHGVTATQIGLGNVNNTSDLNKPISTATQTALNAKQNKLTAGNFISIDSNNKITTTYTAGTGIAISSTGVISNTQTSAEWGKITGTLSSQTDLQTALNAKQAKGNYVTTDTTQTVTGVKTFQQSSDTALVKVQNSTTALGTTPTAEKTTQVRFDDKNGDWIGLVSGKVETNGSTSVELCVRKPDKSGSGFISVDSDASGNITLNASDGVKDSVKSWVSSVSVDNKSITKNASDEIQAVGVINVNTASVVKTWTGTLAEYTALATKSDDIQYIITDDDSAGTNVYTKAEVDSLVTSAVAEANAHRVIAFQAPMAANNYTWYRKYADGWIEQGGRYAGRQNISITMPVEMSDSNYSVVLTFETASTATSQYSSFSIDTSKTASTFTIKNFGSIYGGWEVRGMFA